MMAFDAWLAARGIVALVTALIYAYVARLVLARRLSSEGHRANLAFATWWWTLGAVQLLAGAYTLPAAFGLRDLALVVTLLNLLLLLIAVALGALVYFLVYLYTGSQRAFWPIAVGYSILGVAMLYLVAWMQPTGFDEAKGAGELVYTRRLEGFAAILFGLVVSGPVLLATIGYGSLYFRATLRAQRLRIATIAGAFVVWFGWSLVSGVLQLQEKHPNSRPLFVVNSALSVGVPLVVTLAYRPPRWIRERLDEGAAVG